MSVDPVKEGKRGRKSEIERGRFLSSSFFSERVRKKFFFTCMCRKIAFDAVLVIALGLG